MIMLLPPSETKRPGGDGPPLCLDALSSPELGPLRTELLDELVKLARDRPACRRALALSAAQDAEIDRNAQLPNAPTLPAIIRHNGVLYDALDVDSLRAAAASRARARLAAAVRVDVIAEHPDGKRAVVTHLNKAHKGRLARVLATSRAEPDDAAGVAAVARRAGMRVERRGDDLTVVVA